mmetsp:Transcript_5978/g.22625  ORF Transcript_5978/g.22625 Transcript_5978/m.22625 type:complete len:521 (+) Transcript_5978:353-1915(+)
MPLSLSKHCTCRASPPETPTNSNDSSHSGSRVLSHVRVLCRINPLASEFDEREAPSPLLLAAALPSTLALGICSLQNGSLDFPPSSAPFNPTPRTTRAVSIPTPRKASWFELFSSEVSSVSSSKSNGTYVTSQSSFMTGRFFLLVFRSFDSGNSTQISLVRCGFFAISERETFAVPNNTSAPNPPALTSSASTTRKVKLRSCGSSTNKYITWLNTGSLLFCTASVLAQVRPFILAPTTASAFDSKSVPTTFSALLIFKQTKPTSRSRSTFFTYHAWVVCSPFGKVSVVDGSPMGTTSRSGQTSLVSKMFPTRVSSHVWICRDTVPSSPSGKSTSNSSVGFSRSVTISPEKGQSVGVRGCSVTITLVYASTSFTPIAMVLPRCVFASSWIFALPDHARSSSSEAPRLSLLVPTHRAPFTRIGSGPKSSFSKWIRLSADGRCSSSNGSTCDRTNAHMLRFTNGHSRSTNLFSHSTSSSSLNRAQAGVSATPIANAPGSFFESYPALPVPKSTANPSGLFSLS